MTRYITVTDTAKLIRKALADKFSGVKFSVKSKSYSGGASITVSWTDGPSDKAVEAVTSHFAGAWFDGMEDLKHYTKTQHEGETVHFGADYVFTKRHFSREFIQYAIDKFVEQYGNPGPALIEYSWSTEWQFAVPDNSREHWFHDMIQELNQEAK